MVVLPTCILLLLLIFYTVLWATNTTVEEATKHGWIRGMDPPPVWYRTWDYLRLNKVAWSALPKLLLTELSMIFVVALSSSLDVAAIELELKRPLDYNKELTTVGISNLASGLTGGYTGSYIFSQTIFSLRAGIQSRSAGYALAACQSIVLVVPFPLLSYLPNYFFGSMLVMICVDLLYEWLWDVRTRVTTTEYIVDLATFGMIQWLGVEYGIFAGVLLYVVCYRLGLNVGETGFGSDDNGVTQAEEEYGLLYRGVVFASRRNGHVNVEYGSTS
jgi:MFS superfamily sulfate permease-like transporter